MKEKKEAIFVNEDGVVTSTQDGVHATSPGDVVVLDVWRAVSSSQVYLECTQYRSLWSGNKKMNPTLILCTFLFLLPLLLPFPLTMTSLTSSFQHVSIFVVEQAVEEYAFLQRPHCRLTETVVSAASLIIYFSHNLVEHATLGSGRSQRAVDISQYLLVYQEIYDNFTDSPTLPYLGKSIPLKAFS